MFRHLFSKTALFLALLFIVTVALLGQHILQTMGTINQEATQQMHRQLASHILHESPLLPHNLTDKQAVKDAFHLMMVLGPNLELYILDKHGRILNYSADKGKVLREQVGLKPILRFLEKTDRKLILGDDPRALEQQKPFSVAPIEHNGERIGYLYIILGSQNYDSAISSAISDTAWSATLFPLALLLAGTLLTALFIYLVIARPLNQLVSRLQHTDLDDATDSSVTGTPAHRFSLGRAEEISRVEQEFTRFIGKIRQQYKLLENKKNAQHQLFNQIAHDLRTPLSNAMLSLENAERQLDSQHYTELRQSLNTVRSNYQKVIRFISGILDLARLESGQTNLCREPFPLEELVHDCIQDFAVAAEEKQMQLIVNADNRYHLVDIDIPHLARVINNLISNSLRYAAPGTSVELSLVEKDGLMHFSISNECIGEQPLPDLNGDLQLKSSSKLGYGLGLAICQRILKLHESRLDMHKPALNRISFYFSLPLYR